METPVATASPDFQILDSRWFNNGEFCIGAVLILTKTEGFKVTIGPAKAISPEMDAADIALSGVLLDYEAAYGLFADQIIAKMYSYAKGGKIKIKYDSYLHKPLYNKAQTL